MSVLNLVHLFLDGTNSRSVVRLIFLLTSLLYWCIIEQHIGVFSSLATLLMSCSELCKILDNQVVLLAIFIMKELENHFYMHSYLKNALVSAKFDVCSYF
jgi:hypothetical protein